MLAVTFHGCLQCLNHWGGVRGFSSWVLNLFLSGSGESGKWHKKGVASVQRVGTKKNWQKWSSHTMATCIQCWADNFRNGSGIESPKFFCNPTWVTKIIKYFDRSFLRSVTWESLKRYSNPVDTRTPGTCHSVCIIWVSICDSGHRIVSFVHVNWCFTVLIATALLYKRIPANTFPESNVWDFRLVMTRIVENVPAS